MKQTILAIVFLGVITLLVGLLKSNINIFAAGEILTFLSLLTLFILNKK